MKTHKKFTITEAHLRKFGACDYGIVIAKPLLPAVVSSDPSENVELAIRVLEGDDIAPDVRWLAIKLNCDAHPDSGPTCWCSACGRQDSVMLCQQYLAFIADKLLTMVGK